AQLSALDAAGGPVSAYNGALAAGGRFVAFEASAGNENFAKRYGQMTVVVRDLASGTSVPVSHENLPPDAPARTAYNPTISGDGRLVAFEASDAGRDGRPSTNGLWLVHAATGATRRVRSDEAGATYDPKLSADGSTLVFVAPSRENTAQVHALDVRSGEVAVVSRAAGERGAPADRDAVEPAVSADGQVVTFASGAGNLGTRGRDARVHVRDRQTHTTTAVPARGPAFGPAVSPDGGHVAVSVRRDVDAQRPEGGGAELWLHDRTVGAPRLVSRAAGPDGRAADAHSLEAAVSRGGRLVAFTSTAGNLDPRKPAGVPGVFVRDTTRGTTRLMSSHAPRMPVEREPEHDAHG
ncbi:MAG: hypothetical protein M3370_00785, partial [Actinomycetota bacterium]|nr:hypothetical protein [Actinomycetota bacterium]